MIRPIVTSERTQRRTDRLLDEAGDRKKAIALQDEALVITREMGMKPLTERILKRREILRA